MQSWSSSVGAKFKLLVKVSEMVTDGCSKLEWDTVGFQSAEGRPVLSSENGWFPFDVKGWFLTLMD